MLNSRLIDGGDLTLVGAHRHRGPRLEQTGDRGGHCALMGALYILVSLLHISLALLCGLACSRCGMRKQSVAPHSEYDWVGLLAGLLLIRRRTSTAEHQQQACKQRNEHSYHRSSDDSCTACGRSRCATVVISVTVGRQQGVIRKGRQVQGSHTDQRCMASQQCRKLPSGDSVIDRSDQSVVSS